MIKKKTFGYMPDGREVSIYSLSNGTNMKVKITDYGAAIVSIKVPDRYGRVSDVVCGYDSLDDYLGGGGEYQGAIIGRCGNRIAKGHFTLDGKKYDLCINSGANHLHGGKEGFDSKLWNCEIKDFEEPELICRYISPDGEENYPGNLDVTVTYKLTKDNGLSINYLAKTDKKTVVNLTNHAYFNLAGYAAGPIFGHTLWIDADTYTATDDTLVPTGEFISVEGTPFDFRAAKTIGQDFFADNEDIKKGSGYDHNFCLNRAGILDCKAILCDPASGRAMKVITDQPGMQVYTANFMDNVMYPFKGGRVQTANCAVCLETQAYPDSINHSNFPSVVLDVGEEYNTTTIYQFFTE